MFSSHSFELVPIGSSKFLNMAFTFIILMSFKESIEILGNDYERILFSFALRNCLSISIIYKFTIIFRSNEFNSL